MSKKAQSHPITDVIDICANAAAGKIPYEEAERKLGLTGFVPLPIMVYPNIVITIKIRQLLFSLLRHREVSLNKMLNT